MMIPLLFYFRCVLNWFGDWSTGALYQVGREFTNKIDLERGNVSLVSVCIHALFVPNNNTSLYRSPRILK